jgi:hypothetical protein
MRIEGNRLQPPTQTLEHVLGADPAVLRGYARAIDDALADRGALSLADRDRLVSRGQRLGLKRFDANLVIAAMEQRHRDRRVLRFAGDDGEVESAPRLPRWLAWSTAIGIQAAIVAGVWWVVS